jgi:hypothetical protein
VASKIGNIMQANAPNPASRPPKTRVWGFFGKRQRRARHSASQVLDNKPEAIPSTAKFASGLPVWPARDPIGERGGYNLYVMVGNDPVGKWDLRGLEGFTSIFHGWSVGAIRQYGRAEIIRPPGVIKSLNSNE